MPYKNSVLFSFIDLLIFRVTINMILFLPPINSKNIVQHTHDDEFETNCKKNETLFKMSILNRPC